MDANLAVQSSKVSKEIIDTLRLYRFQLQCRKRKRGSPYALAQSRNIQRRRFPK